MNTFVQDLRYALRQIRRSPGFSAIAILSLALGIGANTAIFTLINGLILKSLPVRDPQQLVAFGNGADSGQIDGIDPGPLDIFPYDFYKQIERQHDPFQDVSATGSFPIKVSVRSAPGGVAGQAMTQLVSGSFFSTLGVEPVLGRPIVPGDADAPGRNPVAVLELPLLAASFRFESVDSRRVDRDQWNVIHRGGRCSAGILRLGTECGCSGHVGAHHHAAGGDAAADAARPARAVLDAHDGPAQRRNFGAAGAGMDGPADSAIHDRA